jgi:hypothetical protein
VTTILAFENVTMDVLDARTMKVAWTRKFGEAPRYFVDTSAQSAAFLWTATSERVKRDPAYKDTLWHLAPWPASDNRNCSFFDFSRVIYNEPLTSGLFLAEAVDLATGEVKTPVAVDLVDRCIGVRNATFLGPSLLLQDNRNRVLVYRADSPHAHLRLFGYLLATDPIRNRIAVGKEAGHVVIYDGTSGEQIEDLKFPAPVVMIRFRSSDGTLLALTSKQEAITLILH